MRNMEINFNETKEIWDEFVLNSPQGSIFVNSQFLDSLNTGYNLITCYENNKIIAGVPLLFSETGKPINTVFPFTQYQGIMLSKNEDSNPHSIITREFKHIEYFIGELINKYRSCCLCQSWKFSDMRPFQWHNYGKPDKGIFDITLRYTGILNINNYNDFEEYFSSIRSIRRQEFRKAEKKLQFNTIINENILDELLHKTFERQGLQIDIMESTLVKAITAGALQNGYGKLYAANLEDKIISAALFLYFNNTAYYLFSANDPEYRDSFGNCFLMLNIINILMNEKSHKIDEIDFVGVNSPNRGDYKISFNAELKPYFVATFKGDTQ